MQPHYDLREGATMDNNIEPVGGYVAHFGIILIGDRPAEGSARKVGGPRKTFLGTSMLCRRDEEREKALKNYVATRSVSGKSPATLPMIKCSLRSKSSSKSWSGGLRRSKTPAID
jgi:hypothetical protein